MYEEICFYVFFLILLNIVVHLCFTIKLLPKFLYKYHTDTHMNNEPLNKTCLSQRPCRGEVRTEPSLPYRGKSYVFFEVRCVSLRERRVRILSIVSINKPLKRQVYT